MLPPPMFSTNSLIFYFYFIGTHKFISHWQKCVDGNGSDVNKNVFESSYNDLIFTIQYHNLFSTNLTVFFSDKQFIIGYPQNFNFQNINEFLTSKQFA